MPFLIQSVRFIVAILLLLQFADWAMGYFLQFDEKLKTNLVEHPPEKIDLLFMGDSRVAYGINPKVVAENLNSATSNKTRPIKPFLYNGGVPATTIIDDFLLLHLMLKHNHGPRAIVLQFAPEDFADSLQFNPSPYFRWGHDPEVSLALSQFEPTIYYVRPAPFFEYLPYNNFLLENVTRGALKKLFGFVPVKRGVAGYFPRRIMRSRETMKKGKDDYSFSIQSYGIVYLTKFLQTAQKASIPVLVYSSPRTNHFEFSPTKRDSVINLLETISNRYEAVYCDLHQELKAFQVNPQNFNDPVHFSTVGVQRFSKLLAQKIQNWDNYMSISAH